MRARADGSNVAKGVVARQPFRERMSLLHMCRCNNVSNGWGRMPIAEAATMMRMGFEPIQVQANANVA